MPKNSIQNMMIMELLVKRKKLNILTINLTCYQFMNSCPKKDKNSIQMDFDGKSLYSSAMWDKK